MTRAKRPPIKIKHRETVIQTVFALEVSDDEQIPQQPVVARLTAFTEAAFIDAYRQIKAARDEARAATENGQPDSAD